MNQTTRRTNTTIRSSPLVLPPRLYSLRLRYVDPPPPEEEE
jgi:hypothetical protein